MVLPLHQADGGPVSLGVGALLTAGTSSLHSTAHFGAEFRRAGRSLTECSRRFAMPRASWRGFLRLSLVTCPVYLSPATTHTKPIRLHQVWQPAPVEVNEDELPDRSAAQQGSASSAPRLPAENGSPDADQSRAATRIALRPHDPGTGEEIDKREVVKGYEYGRGQFVTFTPEELKGLDAESSKEIDLEKFVPRGDLDPVYFDSSYYLYPDGPVAVEMLRVIGAAMAEAGVVGLGRLTLSRRERMVVVEPRGTGMALFTLRAAEEVRAAQFGMAEGELDAEMVAIAKAIIAQRTGSFDPTTYRDRYQEALQELIEAKMKGLTVKPREIAAPPPVIDLMTALGNAAWRGKPVRSTPRRRRRRWRPIGASRLSCCPFPGVGNGKHRPPPSPPLPTQGGANKQLPDPNSLFAASVSTRCARRDRPEAGRRPRYRKFESISLQRRVACEPAAGWYADERRGGAPRRARARCLL